MRETSSPGWQKASSVRRMEGGDVFLYNQNNLAGKSYDIWQRPLGAANTAHEVLATAANESEAAFSPDGHWIAYESNTSDGRADIYVKGYPDGPNNVVSPEGGAHLTGGAGSRMSPVGETGHERGRDPAMGRRAARG